MSTPPTLADEIIGPDDNPTDESTGGSTGDARPWWRNHVFEVVVALTFAVAVLTGTTTSSLGVAPMQVGDRGAVGLLAGTPRMIRSDEWLTNTPIVLGVIASKRGDPVTPLGQSVGFVYQVPRGGIAESVVFFDGSLLFAPLPAAMLFAANWWLPVLLLGLFMPTWLQRLGAPRQLAVLATWLTLLAPATAWWSLEPVRVVGYTIAGAVCAMLAVERCERRERRGRHRLQAAGLVLVAGVMVARLPTFYVPWSITISLGVVFVTAAFLLARPGGVRVALVVLAGTGVVAGVLYGGFVLENLAAIRAYSSTVYPGDRRATGTPLSLFQVFGAPALGKLQDEPPLLGTNYSEISSSWSVAAVWAAVLLAVAPRRRTAVGGPETVDPLAHAEDGESAAAGDRAGRVAVVVAALFTGFWLAWCTVSWGTPGSHLPLVNRVTPERAAETVGFMAVVLLVLVLGRRARTTSWRSAVVCAVVCGGVTAYAASSLRTITPTGVASVAAAAGGTGLAVLLVTRFPRSWWATTVTVALALSVVVTANPLQRGVGGFRDNPTADAFLAAGRAARADHTLWVSDAGNVDAMFTATGVPALSGRQITGPVVAEWKRLDPTGQFEANWNRGNVYVAFTWVSGVALSMTNSSPDRVTITMDPCALRATGFPVTRLVASTPLTESCLTPVSTFSMGGAPRYVYALGG